MGCCGGGKAVRRIGGLVAVCGGMRFRTADKSARDCEDRDFQVGEWLAELLRGEWVRLNFDLLCHESRKFKLTHYYFSSPIARAPKISYPRSTQESGARFTKKRRATKRDKGTT